LSSATRNIVSTAIDNSPAFDRIRKQLPGVLITLGLVACLTAVLFLLVWESGLARGSIAYLIPVVIAATRWGIVPALVAAGCGVFASAFFFYPPAYSFRVKEPQEVIDLILFIFVAVTVS
jgi:two-component system sensor histidine kinase KdpD